MATTYFPNSEQFDLMNAHLASIASAIAVGGDFDTFEGMQRAVRAGIAPNIFTVGSQFTVPHSVYGNLVCEVVAYDYLKSIHDQNAHTMTCKTKVLFPTIQFDAPEAFYATDELLPAGTYHFSLSANYSSWLAGTYQFTLTSPVPKGGQLCFDRYSADKNFPELKVVSYASPSSTTPIETVDITEGDGGTNLGDFGNTLNSAPRTAQGSNNYKESALRQLLNSSAAAGEVWTPQTKFDRPPSWANSEAGFVAGLGADFLAVVGAVNLPCVASSQYESPDSAVVANTSYVLKDRFYLPSQNEVYGEKTTSADKSVLLPYYEGATDADRIAYTSAGVPGTACLRTPNPSTSHSVRFRRADGTMSGNNGRTLVGYEVMFTIV